MRFPEDVPTLSDGVVTLRAHRSTDIDTLFGQGSDPEMAAWTTVPAPYARQDAVEFVESVIPKGWADGSNLGFAIEHDGRFAGTIDLRPRDRAEAEIGFGLHPGARGKGVMHRAINLLLDWAFVERGHSVVTWRAFVGNWASRRVVWSTGFHFGPTVPGLCEQRGGRRDAWTGWIGADDSRQPKTRWLEVPRLESARLRLRAWHVDDGHRLVEASNDQRLRHFIAHSPLPHATQDVGAYLLRVHQAAADGTRLAWCIADRATDQALGNIALFDFAPDCSAQVGYWSHPAARGRGVMSEAARMATDWALAPEPEGMGLRRLYLLTAVSNAASRHVAEQAGFKHVGTERAAAPVATAYEDNAVYDRLADPV
jgi:RimJ/RimL family protein N-acetyltransferase